MSGPRQKTKNPKTFCEVYPGRRGRRFPPARLSKPAQGPPSAPVRRPPLTGFPALTAGRPITEAKVDFQRRAAPGTSLLAPPGASFLAPLGAAHTELALSGRLATAGAGAEPLGGGA